MIVVFSLITLIYICTIIMIYVGYNNVKSVKTKPSETPTSTFSIIIPFRNEAKNLKELIKSLNIIDYPKELFEVVFVNDNSTDSSTSIINDHNMLTNTVVINSKRMSNSPKKDAIQTAILNSQFNYIITTDADCIVPKSWLHAYNSIIIDKHPKFIAAPVTYEDSNKLLAVFQLHDFLSLQAVTIGAFGLKKPFMCNGANLCYTKSVFLEVNGFEGNLNMASGDDVFFMEKVIQKYPNDIFYLKSLEAIVYTKPLSSIKSLLHQRMRWAGKTSAFSGFFSKAIALIVLLMNISLILYLIFAFLNDLRWYILMLIFLIKISFDFLLIKKSMGFFKQKKSCYYYPINSILYPFFTLIVVFASFFFKYRWKGRTFKK